MSSPYRALIFGASGITGWAIAREALHYPSSSIFDKVIGLTNRPLTKIEALLPDDERLRLYSGVDLTAGVESVEKSLRAIEGIEGVTHVYFTAYTGHGTGFDGIKKANVEILQNAVLAVENICPLVQKWTFQTGGKWYGFEFSDKIGIPELPIKETSPRIPEPYAANIMYYAQYDLLQRLSDGKKWSFVEIRPDAVSGFVPSNNAMNLTQSLGLFFSFFASREGAGAKVPYPGPLLAYEAQHTDVSQTVLARFHIHASLHGEPFESYNIGDEDAGTSWAEMWPEFARYFGLVDTAPVNNSLPTFNIDAYMQEHRGEWKSWVKKHGLKDGTLENTDFGFLTVMMGMAIFGRNYDLGKARNLGFTESRKSVEGYLEGFDLMKKAGIIPK